MKKYLKRFWKDEEGAEMLEYAIVILVVCVLAAVLIKVMGTANNKLTQAQTEIDGIDVSLGAGEGGTNTQTNTNVG